MQRQRSLPINQSRLDNLKSLTIGPGLINSYEDFGLIVKSESIKRIPSLQNLQYLIIYRNKIRKINVVKPTF